MSEVSVMRQNSVLDLLPDFQRWKKANPDSSLASYIRPSVRAEELFAVSEILLPSLIQHEGCIFLRDNFSQKVFYQWLKKFDGDLTKVERVMNHRHVRDVAAFLEHTSWAMVEAVGSLLKTGIELQLRRLYNEMPTEIEIIRTASDFEITFYLNR